MYLHNKARTVFRAISRVGTSGLEWTPNDTTKCANLLAYYIKTGRGRKICSACGSVPSDVKCPQHGGNFMKDSTDMDNLSATHPLHSLIEVNSKTKSTTYLVMVAVILAMANRKRKAM